MRSLLALFCMLAGPVHSASLTFATESYPPFSFLGENGIPGGAGVEQINRMMRELGSDTPYSIEIVPWARALALAETQPDHCVFATARTPERENRFQWVGPLHVDHTTLVKRAGSAVSAPTLSAAKSYRIGTQRDDYTQEILRQMGFSEVDLSASFSLTLAKLLGGRIDLMPMSNSVIRKLLNERTPIERVVALSEQQLSIACNKRVAPALIARMQAVLAAQNASGIRDRIYRAYGILPNP